MVTLDILPEVFVGYAAALLDSFFGFLQDVLKSPSSLAFRYALKRDFTSATGAIFIVQTPLRR
jgi:hypothetical protein